MLYRSSNVYYSCVFILDDYELRVYLLITFAIKQSLFKANLCVHSTGAICLSFRQIPFQKAFSLKLNVAVHFISSHFRT